MRRFRRLFAFIFILSIFAGIAHELSHAHHEGDFCEVCVLAHAPALIDDAPILPLITQTFEPFSSPQLPHPIALVIQSRNRSPPLI